MLIGIAEDQRAALLRMMEGLLCATRIEMEELRIARSRIENSARPAVRLPSELLGVVFELVCFSNAHPSATPEEAYGPGLQSARYEIMSVCSRWMQVALSTTSIWSNICLHLDNWRSPSILNMLIERSGGRSVELYLDTEFWETMCPVVSGVTSQCRVLSLRIHDSVNALGLFPSTTISHLHTLVYNAQNATRETVDGFDLTTASSLRNISISTRNGPVPRYRLQLPSVCGVLKLSLSGQLNPADAIIAINSCSKLETLHWRCYVRQSNAIGLPTVLPHTTIIHLRLEGVIPVDAFQNFHLPKLIRLDVEHGPIPFISNNSRFPLLRHLHIRAAHTDVAMLPAFVSSHTNIQELALDGVPSRALVEALGVGRLGYPNLTDVWIRCDPRDTGTTVRRADDLLAQWDRHGSSSIPFVLHVGGIFPNQVLDRTDGAALMLKYVPGGRAVFDIKNYEDRFWNWDMRIQ